MVGIHGFPRVSNATITMGFHTGYHGVPYFVETRGNPFVWYPWVTTGFQCNNYHGFPYELPWCGELGVDKRLLRIAVDSMLTLAYLTVL